VGVADGPAVPITPNQSPLSARPAFPIEPNPSGTPD
jgi:hypothetical protein